MTKNLAALLAAALLAMTMQAAASEPLGIEACNAFLTRFEACLATIEDERNREAYKENVDSFAEQ
jgi:hypothetical protein